MAGSGKVAVSVLCVGVAAAFTATALYPIFLAKERPAQAGERPLGAARKGSVWGEMKKER